MKKIISILFVIILIIFTITGCGSSTDTSSTKTDKNNESKTDTVKISVSEQLTSLGFTEDEAKTISTHFSTIGVNEAYDMVKIMGNNLDGLCSFRCFVYDSKRLTLNFTTENRELCFAEIAGIPTVKTDYYYINLFGNLKRKVSASSTSVTMYDVWDEDGEVIPGAIGYKAVFDYENSKIEEYSN